MRLKKPKFLAIDFFCGAGGTTRGLIDAGGYVIAGIDKEEKCRDTYIQNNKNEYLDKAVPEYLNYDIFRKTRKYPEGQQKELLAILQTLINKYKKKYPKIPLFFAICAPCQPFTGLSKNGFSDERKIKRDRDSSLLSVAAEFVKTFEPELILSENVTGITNAKYGGVWGKFEAKLKKLGYVTGTKIVCASKFGIPQHRKRSILLGVRNRFPVNEGVADMVGKQVIVPTSDPASGSVSVYEAIGHFPALNAGEAHPEFPNHRARKLKEINYKRLSCAKPGEPNAYLEKTKYGDLSLKCHKEAKRRNNQPCFTDVYTRMDPDKPSPTITTKCVSVSNGRFGHYDTEQVRGISLREAAALQSFPDDYIFFPEEQSGSVARMIGNAVPPRLAQFFANHLVCILHSPSSNDHPPLSAQ